MTRIVILHFIIFAEPQKESYCPVVDIDIVHKI
jgi:hypothetical protein